MSASSTHRCSVNVVSRRAAIGTALAATAGVLLPRRHAHATPRQDESGVGGVVVVGAGFAGLACAHELNRIGYDTVVIDARDRVGGRVQSLLDLHDGDVVEAGGEAIGEQDLTWKLLASRFGLELEPLPPIERDTIGVMLNGRRFGEAETGAVIEAAARSVEALAPLARIVDPDRPWLSPSAAKFDKLPVKSWMDAAMLTGPGADALTALLTGLFGVAPERQSLLALLCRVAAGGLEGFWEGRRRWRCAGGNAQLADGMASSFGADRLFLEHPVESIDVAEDRVALRCTTGLEVTAADVVLTAPPTTWDRIRITPALPQFLTPQMGRLVRYVGVRRDAWWGSDQPVPLAIGDGALGLASARRGAAPEGEPTPAILLGQAGSAAAQALSDAGAQAGATCLTTIGEMLPGAADGPVEGRFVDWVGDPWSRCGAAFAAPGQVTTVGPFLRNGAGRLHFAGDYCSYGFAGTMEGALSTGVATARRLAKRDGVTVPPVESAPPA